MYISYYDAENLYRAPRYNITINTADRTMTLFNDGKTFKIYPIIIGNPTDSISAYNIKKQGGDILTEITSLFLLIVNYYLYN
jgi:hypothetical protein